MAEICCGLVSGAEPAADACDSSSRGARRRRLKIVPGVESVAVTAHLKPKRTRFELPEPICSDASPPSSDLEASMSSVSLGGRRPRYGVTSVCGRRRDMEDAVSIVPDLVEGDLHFFGVFDGHGCSHVAASCKDRMHEIIKDEIEVKGREILDWKEIMERGFARMDAEAVACAVEARAASCRCELQTPKCDAVGSTAVVAVVSPDLIVVANCGDSRAVLCRRAAAVPLSDDHKPDRPDELNRIQEAGGRVIYWEGARVLGVLAMSRAIGDSYLKPYVVAEPEVTVTERTDEDECLILASDGLWDVVSNETACDVVRMCLRGNRKAGRRVGSDKACSDATMLLAKLALARGSADNVSVLVVDLRRNS